MLVHSPVLKLEMQVNAIPWSIANTKHKKDKGCV